MAPSGAVPRETPRSVSELGLRVVSAIALVAVALAVTWFGGWAFALLWLAAGLVIAGEALAMSGAQPRRGLLAASALGLAALAGAAYAGTAGTVALGVAAVAMAALALIGGHSRDRLWAIGGWVYAAIVVWVPVVLRDQPGIGLVAILWMFAVVWSTDIAAFFVGRRFGGPRLWRRVSPGKTWSGFFGGLVAGTLAGMGVVYAWREAGHVAPLGLASLGLVSALASVASQAGDLGESALKRLFAVKDSGHLIPGHGGAMDRLDGFVAVAFLVGIALVGTRAFGAQG